MLIINPFIPFQRLLQVLRAVEARCRQHLADAPVKAFYHAVRLRVTRRTQAMLDAILCAHLVKNVFARGGSLAATLEPVGEFFSVVGQYLNDDKRRFFRQPLQKTSGVVRALVRQNFQIDLPRVARSMPTNR